MIMESEKKVVIAMSGGVDSSVAAALLVEQGYSVTGMMLKLWSDECEEAENACCPPEAIDQARQVANIIGIPFYVLDVQEIFKQIVVDSFITSLNLGLTPNPCYLCNKNIRWGIFLDRVLDSGYEYFSTGHYARVTFDGTYYQLHKGVDPKKDQSYVLSGLDQTQLSHSIFPLGGFTKVEVREMAHKFNLPVAEKQDSQDLCFIGKSGYRDFLRRHSQTAFLPGNIINLEGAIVGKHDGLSNFTIGQRKGLGAGNEEPVYVIDKDISTNELIIGTLDHLGRSRFSVTDVNWIAGKEPETEFDCFVKIRYKAVPVKAHVIPSVENKLTVEVDHPLRDITPGQIAVFYQEDNVLGSGMINKVIVRGEKI
jgi:tRNA-specific 2-thiouridylase